jgi:hypothetical protein
MSGQVEVRVRRLPDGAFREATQISLEGRFLELDIGGETLPLGALLEIENGPTLLWGQLQQRKGDSAIVAIEHSLDTSRLGPIREVWGE